MTRLRAVALILALAVALAACSAGGRAAGGGVLTVSGAWARAADKGGTSTVYQGMTGMQHTAGIPIPAGTTVGLAPGGYHVMLDHLAADLAAGSTVRLTLTFEQTGPLEVTAEVRAD